MGVTVANSTYILKTLWPQKRVENTVYRDHALLAMIPKDTNFVGQNMILAVRYADSQGRSAAFATAQTNAGNHQGATFTLTRKSDYQVVKLTTEAILASKNDKGALIKNLDTEMDSGMNNIGKSLATALFRGSSGAIGQSVGIPTATTITLANINDVTSFEVGMVLQANATKTGASGAMKTTPATATITGIDRDTGVLTFGAGTFTGTNWAANDFLYAQGDYDAKVSGLDDWLPSTAPGATPFFGCVRNVDATRLGGLRVDVSGLNPEEAMVTLFSKQSREGGRPTHLFTNHLDYRNVEISVGSKVQYEDLSVGEIGFRALKLNGPRGPVSILADQDCPSGVGFSLDMKTWKLYSLDECPMILDMDGDKLARVYNADEWEARIVYFAQLGCTAPGFNVRAALPA